jgi:RHS repeat-associated protein
VIDGETGLICYGSRYLAPKLGRGLGCERAQENGGTLLYLFVRNSPIATFDDNGRMPTDLEDLVTYGQIAKWSDKLFTLSSYPFCGSIENDAVAHAVAINEAFDGALFKNSGLGVVQLDCTIILPRYDNLPH